MRAFVLYTFIGLAVPLFLSCGTSPSAKLSLAISSSALSENPIRRVQELKLQGLSRGLYFYFDLMKPSPASIDDVANPNFHALVSPPEGSILGSDATEIEFTIDTSSLDPNSFYRVTVQALSTDQGFTPTHVGKADCPLKLSLKERNLITICFGPINTTLGCGNSRPWSACTFN
jgi:hypothetical protein